MSLQAECPKSGSAAVAGQSAILARSGSLEARLASSEADLVAAQQLRHRVFFQGRLDRCGAADSERDICRYDSVSDHILVIDRDERGDRPQGSAVGVCRVLRREVAEANFGFCSAEEFDLAPMLARQPKSRVAELGRTCVSPDYRGGRVLEMLWRGIWAYVGRHRIEALFGCASFSGSDPSEHSEGLNLLRRSSPTTDDWSVAAMPGRGVAIADFRAQRQFRDAVRGLPPLLKGYLRLGAQFGAEAVPDFSFGSTDIFVVMPIADIEHRYVEYFGCGDGPAIAA